MGEKRGCLKTGLLGCGALLALVVAGVDGWADVARALELDLVAVVDEVGTLQLTPAMRERIHLSAQQELEVIETEL